MYLLRENSTQNIWIHQDADINVLTAAAAAKSLQSCPTLCDPIDGSTPGSAVPGILQARTLEWVAISFSNALKWKVKSESEVAQLCPTLSDPMDCSLPGSSAHGIFQARVLEWSAIAFSSTNDAIFQSINYLLNAKVENLHFAFSLKKAIGIFCEQVNIRDGFLSLSVFYSPLPSPLHTQQWYHIAEWMKG